MRLLRIAAVTALAAAAILPRAGTAEPPRAKPAPLADTAHTAAEVKAAQKAWADYLKVPVEEQVDLGGGVKLDLVLIPPGTFWMGSPEGEKERRDNEKQHRVTLTKAFYLGKYEVTQAQYKAVAGENPSVLKGADLPVENVEHTEAIGFCEKVGPKAGGGRVCRLPTEAEWEYACRGGDFSKESSPFHFEAPSRSLSSAQANFNGTWPYGGADQGRRLGKTCRVGAYRPNRFGLYDMHGNVWEWCGDRYGEYPKTAVADPTGPGEGSDRVLRGGGWLDSALECRSARRERAGPDSCDALGFRIARIPSGQ